MLLTPTQVNNPNVGAMTKPIVTYPHMSKNR